MNFKKLKFTFKTWKMKNQKGNHRNLMFFEFSREGYTALLWASEFGQTKIVELLIEKGSNIEANL